MLTAYYNEIEPYCCAWLSNLMDAGLITPGVIDDRSIADVSPDDLAGFLRCHFFAGVGGWDLAINLAGWPEDAEVWTGSCPCQPFSAAGKRKGAADERHLWPELGRLIAECSPSVVFGEQVASKDGRKWLARVRFDLEALGYGVGGADLCAAGAGEEGEGWFVYPSGVVVRERTTVGAPHIRQRLFWGACSLGNAEGFERGLSAKPERQRNLEPVRAGKARIVAESDQIRRGTCERDLREGQRQPDAAGGSETHPLDIAEGQRDRVPTDAGSDCQGAGEGRKRGARGSGSSCELGDANSARRDARSAERQERGETRIALPSTGSEVCGWSDFAIIPCTDGKSRRIESGSFPLAHGVPRSVGPLLAALAELGIDSKSARRLMREARSNRTGRLKGFGNAIVPRLAAEFVGAFMDVRREACESRSITC